MPRFFAWCVVFATLLASQNSLAVNSNAIKVFTSKDHALAYASQKELAGHRTNLTTQKQNKQRYIIYLKGYRQWSVAFKQAQSLEQRGYNNIEVVKGQFERGYSIIIAQLLSKEKAGKVFNRLRSLGLKNVKVKTDSIKLVRYIVMVHPKKKVTVTETVIVKAEPAKPIKLRNETKPKIKTETAQVKKTQPVSKLPEKGLSSDIPAGTDSLSLGAENEIIIISDEEEISGDELIIVMSDASDVTYEIEMGEDLESSNFDWAVDKIVLEEELFSRSASDVDNAEYAQISAHMTYRASENWELRLGARIDTYNQHGSNNTDVNDLMLDYEDSYIRYRDETMRVTVGTQTIRWGRADILAPTDNLATLDLSRGVLPNWDDLYRSSLALRGELFSGNSKLDFVYLPDFREAQLPEDRENVWYPVNFNKGTILGGRSTTLSTIVLKNATIDDDVNGDGGFGLRFSSTANAIDYALTVQRIRLSAPTYKINEQFRQALLVNPYFAIANQNSYGYTYSEEHPRNWVIGGDMAFQWQQFTFRVEGAWFSDLPATTKNLEYKTYDGAKWTAGVEFYPGDADTRVILQFSGNHINEKEKIIDRDNSLTLNGETESLFSNNRWRFSTKFSLGLDVKDIYISPEIAYLGWEPFEVYSAVHYLEGSEQSLGGFYQENTMFTIGWRGRY